MPYALRCRIDVDVVRPAELVATTVSGDLRGPARLELAPTDAGSTARLVWSLDLGNPVLARLAQFGRPVMSWAHDVVVATGVEQFRRRALVTDAGGPATVAS